MRVNFLGNRTQLPLHVQNAIQFAEESSNGNNGMHLMIAANYGGRYDIVEATKKIAAKVKHGILEVEDIDDNLIEQQLETNVIDDFPNPDLLIRTSGEMRISNYMLWQLAYTELFFCNKMFPEFGEEDLLEVMTAFEKRQRRYGGSFVTTKNII